MDSTAQLGLPLVMQSQAQKHVTVNEALAKLDAFAQLRLGSLELHEPPTLAKPGQSYVVAYQGVGLWAGKGGKIATFSNGGWTFTDPLVGWNAWIEDAGAWAVFNGTDWVQGAVAVRESGTSLAFRIAEFEHIVVPGLTNETQYAVPEATVVLGITGRVIDALGGTRLLSWRLGVHGFTDRYGTNLGTQKNSFILGLTGTPLAYYVATPLLLSAEEGEFVSGLVRFSVHYMKLLPPRLS